MYPCRSYLGGVSHSSKIVPSITRSMEVLNAIGNLSNLRVLNIQNNQIPVLPDTFDNLSELLECKMDWWFDYDITSKEREFLMQCPNLKGSNRIEVENSHIIGLNFDSLALTELSESIKNLVFLQRLNLSRNMFLQFPEVLTSLSNLKELNYSRNFITKDYQALSLLSSLTKLIFTFNRSIPSDIGNLLNLKDLDLSHDALTDVPPQIMNLHQLKSLNLSNNKLKVSQVIIDLKRLDRLDLSGNNHLKFDTY